MNILYLGYWSINEGLSQAAIIPHLKILSTFKQVKNIHYISLERGESHETFSIDIPKCRHVPLFSRNLPFTIINKCADYYTFPKKLKQLIDENTVDLCIGAGTQAGALLYLATRRNNVPFIVSYYDPHADYMNALGIWRKYNPRYIMLHHWEIQLKKFASVIFSVSEGYKNTLISEGTDSKRVFVAPCTTDLTKFIINDKWRKDIRDRLDWKDQDIVGIYVGKFGDIYFDDEAFILLKKVKQEIPQFKIIVLSSDSKKPLLEKLKQCGFLSEQIHISRVGHSDVPKYLNASDVAFCLHRPHQYSYAYSPIKIGEYWGCGLPVIISENIGDDTGIIRKSGWGIVLKDIQNFSESNTSQLLGLLKRRNRDEIRQLAVTYRNPDIIGKIYAQVLDT